MIKKIKEVFFRMGIEPFIWLAALLFLAISDPHQSSNFTLCPLSNIGIRYCPGCGLGRSASYALHGEFNQSFQMHLLGIPAILILLLRICSIFINTFHNQCSNTLFTTNNKRSPYGQRNAINADT